MRGSLEAGRPAFGGMAVTAPCFRPSLRVSVPREAPTDFERLESRVGQTPRGTEVADGRFTEGLASLVGNLEARPCRMHGDGPTQLGQQEGGRSIQGDPIRRAVWRLPRPLGRCVADSQGSGWLAETASGDAVSAACVAGVEEVPLSGVAASPEFTSGSVWGTARVFGVDGGTVDLSEN